MDVMQELRDRIDETDRKLIEAYTERMEIVRKVADYKKAQGKPIFDPLRERALLQKVSDLAGEEYEADARILYNMIMGLSRSAQYRRMEGESRLEKAIRESLDTTQKVFPARALVACQGVEGAYSQQACDKLFEAPNIMYFKNFESVFAAVDQGLCRYGVLPIENSLAGSVNKVYDLMAKYNFSIARSTRLHIDHNLMAKPGTRLEEVKEIFSHEQAISQCSEFLAGLKNVKVTVFENTAMAAKMVSESERTDVAAISSHNCSALYGLDILKSSVQNIGNNYTRFICISKKLEIYPGANRTSLMLTIANKPGALYQIISRFYSLGINMLKLESRPIPGHDFEFMFYFDIDASVHGERLMTLICQLEHETEKYHYFGSYEEVV